MIEIKQKATIKLLASPGSQSSLPSLPRVNSTLVLKHYVNSRAAAAALSPP